MFGTNSYIANNGNLDNCSNISYVRNIKTPYDVGGIKKGTIFDNTITEVLDKLLYPYVSPTFSSFYIDDQTTSIEAGDTLSGGSRTFKWSTTTDDNIKENTINVFNDDGDNLLEDNSNSGEEDIDIGDDITKTEQITYKFKIEGTNTNDKTFNKYLYIHWYYRLYFGSSDKDTLEADDITNLQNSFLGSGYNRSYDTNADNYKWICYPKDFGEASNFIDNDGGANVAIEDPITVTVTNDFDVDIDYLCYRTTNETADEISIKVS